MFLFFIPKNSEKAKYPKIFMLPATDAACSRVEHRKTLKERKLLRPRMERIKRISYRWMEKDIQCAAGFLVSECERGFSCLCCKAAGHSKVLGQGW